jgi:toxin ParE1/3/4
MATVMVLWAPSALDDVDSIAEYIARDSVELASVFVSRLFHATDRLQEFPFSGRIIPEIRMPDCREIICIVSKKMMFGLQESSMAPVIGNWSNP